MVLPARMATMKDSYSTFFIELYELDLRTGVSYVAACDEDIVFKDRIYTAIPFSRGDIQSSMDEPTQELEIKVGDVTDEHLAYIMNGFDFRGCKATLSRIQYPDSLNDPSLEQILFSGYIDNPSFSEGVFSCVIRNVFPSMEVPQRQFNIPCNSYYGDSVCGLSTCDTWDTVSGVDGTVVFLNQSYATDYWKNGRAKINGESRNIMNSDGNYIHLNLNFLQDNIIGQQILLQRGCDKTQEDCRRHNNLTRFTGFPAIPFESVYR